MKPTLVASASVVLLLIAPAVSLNAQVQEISPTLGVSLYDNYQTSHWNSWRWEVHPEYDYHEITGQGWTLDSTMLTPGGGGNLHEGSHEWNDDNYQGSGQPCYGWYYHLSEDLRPYGVNTPGYHSWYYMLESCETSFTEDFGWDDIGPYEMPQAPWIIRRWETNYLEVWAEEDESAGGWAEIESTQATRTKIELRTGGTTIDGSPVSGQSMWMITVSVIARHLNDTPMPPSAISVLGRTPDAEGRIFILLYDHQTYDLTPAISGASGHQNYDFAFNVGAQRMRLRVLDYEY
jgi:hypothetical protein